MAVKSFVYAIANRKGGVAKTTTTLAVAVALREFIPPDKRVLVIDLDPQGNIARSLQIDQAIGDRCISNVLAIDPDDAAGIRQALADNIVRVDDYSPEGAPRRPNLFVLPSTPRLAAAKEHLVSNVAIVAVQQAMGRKGAEGPRDLRYALSDRLAPLRRAFPYQLIDCPPTLDIMERSVYEYADAAIVPVSPDFLAPAGTAMHTDDILAAQEDGIDIKTAVVLAAMVQPRHNLTKAMLKALRKAYRGTLFNHFIPYTVRVKEAPAIYGQSVVEYEPEHPASIAYRKLAERLATRSA